MSLIHEIHNQKPAVRYIMFGLSMFVALSVVGFYWFTALQKDIFFAMHDSESERQAFLAKQEARAPKPFALISRAADGLTASIGSLIGWDSSKGFDRPANTDNNQAHLLPLAR